MSGQKISSQLFASVVLMSLLSACGVRNSNSLEQASTDDSQSQEEVVDVSDKTLASCSVDGGNIFDGSKYNDFEVKATASSNGFGGVDGSKLKLHFSKLSEAFATDGWEIRVYKGRVSPANDVTLDPVAVGFNFEARTSFGPMTIPTAGGQFLIPGCTVTSTNNCRDTLKDFGYSRLSWTQASTLEAFARSKGINSVRSTNAASFISTVSLNLNLGFADSSVKFLRVEALKNGAKIREVEILIPLFYSNPESYEASRPGYLVRLHPNKDQKNKGWSATDFLNFTRTHCLN
jgi:hypothetical protein